MLGKNRVKQIVYKVRTRQFATAVAYSDAVTIHIYYRYRPDYRA